MSTVINLHDVRAVRDVHQCAQEAVLEIQKGLAVALSADVSNINGRELRQIRDELLRLRRMAVLNSPEADALLKRGIAERGRAPTPDETQEMLRPLLPSVRIHFTVFNSEAI